MVVVMILVSACSGGLNSQWIRTTDGALFWASSVDTTMSYSWKGETFDSIPQFGIRIVHKKVGSLTNILYLYR